MGVGTVIGVLTTTDPNPSDTHTYSLRDDAQGKAKLKGDQLLINYIPNYESPTKRYVRRLAVSSFHYLRWVCA